MSVHEMLEAIEDNCQSGARSNTTLFQYHKQVEDRASKTVEDDIANIQASLTCLKGMCSLQWKPARS